MKDGIVYDRGWMIKARKAQMLTQEDVAMHAGTTNVNYSRIERGLVSPDVKVGIRICAYLNVSPMNFLTEVPVK